MSRPSIDSQRLSPEVLFDLDGTLANLPTSVFGKMTKAGLTSVLGGPRFIRGLESTGVEIGPIASRRPELRRGVTERFVTRAGLSQWFGNVEDVQLCGNLSPRNFGQSERDKARVVHAHAYDRAVGMIEDKPNKLGAELLDLLATLAAPKPILLGAVGPDAERRTIALINSSVAKQFDITPTQEGALFEMGQATLEVVAIPKMDYYSGQNFGEHLLHYARQDVA